MSAFPFAVRTVLTSINLAISSDFNSLGLVRWLLFDGLTVYKKMLSNIVLLAIVSKKFQMVSVAVKMVNTFYILNRFIANGIQNSLENQGDEPAF
jgi:hypothetical protein